MGVLLDVNDSKSVAKAHQAVAANLMSYYKPNSEGTIKPVESNGRNGFQWFEMGMLWGTMNEFTKVTKNYTYFNTIGGALGNASFGSNHSFIGSKVNGKWVTDGYWNDDIAWWAFGGIFKIINFSYFWCRIKRS